MCTKNTFFPPDPPPEPSTGTPEDLAVTNLDGDVTADSWEEAADAATPSPNRETPPTPPTPGTPDEDDEEDSDEIKKPKKKPLDEDDSAPKKEPVNVIFIGHVGECYPLKPDLKSWLWNCCI